MPRTLDAHYHSQYPRTSFTTAFLGTDNLRTIMREVLDVQSLQKGGFLARKGCTETLCHCGHLSDHPIGSHQIKACARWTENGEILSGMLLA